MKKTTLFVAAAVLLSVSVGHFSTKNPTQDSENRLDSLFSALTQEQKHDLKYAVGALEVAPGLNAKLFASEPEITNPTNIDIDHRGRVWVLEAYNYRPAITGNTTHAEGDRIVILEDTDHDGVSDKTKVFYQHKDLNAPLGIMVLGNKVLVSQSPYVYMLTDENGDDVADKREVIFQGVGGDQHDHGIHAFVFGPDGKFYFNFGNSGEQLLDSRGKPVLDQYGNPIDKKHYKQGLVFRCDADFTNIEVLGQNFRNNFEMTIDSYGTIWQSDNDDDGNKGVRINYVMEYGNYGYTDELTGAAWQANRTNIEAEIPRRHWHLNDPGVVPNLLQTGAGSPTGITIYEGALLPRAFNNQVIHCDAGPNVVRAYPVKKEGAGYSATMVNLLYGKRNQWFRPSDVCVAPDGSLMVADWYDPGVGGHQAGDLGRGRIYRVAPETGTYNTPATNVYTIDGVFEALQSPNMAVRYMAWNTISKSGEMAETALKDRFENFTNARMKARVLWLLAKLKNGPKYIDIALQSPNPDLRVTAIRAARQSATLRESVDWNKIAGDDDPQIRREVALALRQGKIPKAPQIWAKLAEKYTGDSRWELEALGIGAHDMWDDAFGAWLKLNPDPLVSAAGRDLVWRSRAKAAVPLLAKLASESGVEIKNRLRYFRAFDFSTANKEKSEALLKIMKEDGSDEVSKLCLRHLDPTFTKSSVEAMQSLKKLLDNTYGTNEYMELAQRFELESETPRLINLALDKPLQMLGRDAARLVLKQNGGPAVWQVINGKDTEKAQNMTKSLRWIGNKASLDILKSVALDPKRNKVLRNEAIRAIGGSWDGEELILELLKTNKIPKEYIGSAVQGVSNAWRRSVRTEAATYLGGTVASAGQKHPAVKDLVQMKGDATKGKTMFANYCAVCHQVNDEGNDFGPKLSEIGSKLAKDGQYLAIMYPSAGVSFGYEGYEVRFKDGSKTIGIVASKTETDLILKFAGGATQNYKMTQVASMKKLDESLMTAGLHENMKTQDLVDLVEYLSSLTRK